MTLYLDEDGSYVLRGRLTPEAGALLERALEVADLALQTGTPHGREEDGLTHSAGQRRADALALVAADALRVGETGEARGEVRAAVADRYQVVVHVDSAALRAGSERGESALAGGSHLPRKRRGGWRATAAGC